MLQGKIKGKKKHVRLISKKEEKKVKRPFFLSLLLLLYIYITKL